MEVMHRASYGGWEAMAQSFHAFSGQAIFPANQYVHPPISSPSLLVFITASLGRHDY